MLKNISIFVLPVKLTVCATVWPRMTQVVLIVLMPLIAAIFPGACFVFSIFSPFVITEKHNKKLSGIIEIILLIEILSNCLIKGHYHKILTFFHKKPVQCFNFVKI